MIVRLESYGMWNKEVVYLDTNKIWAFSFSTLENEVVYKANGVVILDRIISPNNTDEIEFYFGQYEQAKGYFTGELSSVYD